MKGTYLITEFRDKDTVKALGARWDPLRKQWYVPTEVALTGFTPWLPSTALALGGDTASHPNSLASAATVSGLTSSAAPGATSSALGWSEPVASATDLGVVKKGLSLSQLLGGVSRAVANAYVAGVWTTVELTNVRLSNGHVYLEVSERNEEGTLLAKANAVLWASQAQRILPAFEQATGAQLAAGIKLLVRARPVFKAQYGFTLEIDAIDADYTLGDLEARKREIRERLKQDGLFDLNRCLPAPWDFNHVLVIAPEGGAGLGDFQAEADRLQNHGICHFTYALCRFQGDGAAAEIRETLLVALAQIELNHTWRPDAVVIIRGGGAVNDMAWLNDYALVRCVCELGIPVITGIGHERDNTVLDEVANQRCDTPSKAITGIEHTIVQRTREARDLFERLSTQVQTTLARTRQSVDQAFVAVERGARQSVADGHSHATAQFADVKLHAAYVIRGASEAAQRGMTDVRHLSHRVLAQAQREVPTLMADIRTEARQVLRTAQARTESDWRLVAERTHAQVRHRREACDRIFRDTADLAHQTLADGRERAQALVREITGQGPEKTLGRGFALVRDPSGQPVTSATSGSTELTIQFRDGHRQATFTDTPGPEPGHKAMREINS
jgi:exodeoxyribonuclease VII large subunit